MQVTEFKPTLKSIEVPVPSMGKGAVICIFENTVASAVRLQELIDTLKKNKAETTECLIAAMLVCAMRRPDGSPLLPNNDMDTINLVAYQTKDETINALYNAYTKLNPSEKEPEAGESPLDSKKKKS